MSFQINSAGSKRARSDLRMRIRDIYVSRPRILVVGGDPRNINTHNIGELALNEEFKAIKRELRGSQHRDFKPIFAHTTTIDELMHYLNKPNLSIVHIAAHGIGAHSLIRADARDRDINISESEYTGSVCLLDTQRRRRLITMSDLAKMIECTAPSIRLVILNVCHSATQAESLCEIVDCVIAVDGPIGDRAAITFAAAFYRALGNRKSVGNAFSQAVATLHVKRFPEKDLLRCYTKKGIDVAQMHLGRAQGLQQKTSQSSSFDGRWRRVPAKRKSRSAGIGCGILAMSLIAAAMGMGLVTHTNETTRNEQPTPDHITSSIDADQPVPSMARGSGDDQPVQQVMPKQVTKTQDSVPSHSGRPEALQYHIPRHPPNIGSVNRSNVQKSPHSIEFNLNERVSSSPIMPYDSLRDLNKTTVQYYVNLHRAQLKECYDQRLLVDPTISGTVT